MCHGVRPSRESDSRRTCSRVSEAHPRFGVALLQLGGPGSLDDVRPFLFNFFRDLLADNVPAALIRPLAWLIATLRAPFSRQLYASIGGKSPIREQTQAQADALRDELRRRGRDWPVYVAMRNWLPSTSEMLQRAERDAVTDLTVIPLYPQYSYATTRSSVNELLRLSEVLQYRGRLRIIDHYCDDGLYLDALTDVTRKALRAFKAPAAEIHLIFSAHGLPVSYITKGDPYLSQVKTTMAGAVERLAHPGPTHLSFQSRLGPQKWLRPSTDELLQELGTSGARAVCIVPVAFVTEHVETLNEIDIQYRDAAERAGIAEFHRACAVKCHPSFVRCLAGLAERAATANVAVDFRSTVQVQAQ